MNDHAEKTRQHFKDNPLTNEQLIEMIIGLEEELDNFYRFKDKLRILLKE